MEIQFWKDKEKGVIDPFLFSQKAEDFAKLIYEDRGNKNNKNKRTQIRKFYDEILRLNALAKKDGSRNESSWMSILPILHMLTAKAAYAEGRKLISASFREFIKKSVLQVEKPKDLELFSNFFEAFMGFYRLHDPRN